MPSRDSLAAANLANLGSVALDATEYVEAEHWFGKALETWQARFGSRDAHVATALEAKSAAELISAMR